MMRATIKYGNRQRLVSPNPQIWEAPPVAAISRQGGSVDVVLPAGDRCFYHASWTVADNNPAGYWTALGGRVTDSPAVASWGADRLDVVARSTEGRVLHKAWIPPHEEWTWLPSQIEWEDLGGPIVGSPAAVSWGDGRLDIVAHGEDNQVLHKRWRESQGNWSPAGTSWHDLGGQITGSPVVCSWGSGRLDIFVQGLNHGVWHKSWDNAIADWTPKDKGWHLLGQEISGTPAVVSWGQGRLDVFVHGTGHQVWYKSYDASKGGWNPPGEEWICLGGNILGSPSVASWGPGRLDIVVCGHHHAVWHRSYDKSRGGWSPETGWRSLGGKIVGSPIIVSTGEGLFSVFARDKYGALLRKRWDQSAFKWYPSQDEWDYDLSAACY